MQIVAAVMTVLLTCVYCTYPQGMLREGSTVEQQNLRYWIMVGSFGLFSLSSLQNSPHAVVLVFDASLKSFSKMLDVDFKDSQWQAKFPQLACYHTVIDRAAEQGTVHECDCLVKIRRHIV